MNDAQVPKDELVKELRRGTCEYDGVDRIMDEAADEIERLRAVLQHIAVECPWHEWAQRVRDALKEKRS